MAMNNLKLNLKRSLEMLIRRLRKIINTDAISTEVQRLPLLTSMTMLDLPSQKTLAAGPI